MTRTIAYVFVAALLTTGAFSQRRAAGPEVGTKAPTFTLKLLNSEETFSLESNFGKRPTVLIFGSYT